MPVTWLKPFGLAGGIIALVFGILVLLFPRSLNVLVGIYLVIAAAGLIATGGRIALPVGIVSIVLGVLILIFPAALNYLVGVYLLLVGFWFVFGLGVTLVGLILGSLSALFGIVILVSPLVLNYLFGIYLVAAGLISVIRYAVARP
ncbi:MAG: DUF3096 domain-containing protein [Spirochaetota bacterium]